MMWSTFNLFSLSFTLFENKDLSYVRFGFWDFLGSELISSSNELVRGVVKVVKSIYSVFKIISPYQNYQNNNPT